MRLSKLKIIAFFGVLLLLVWVLYPRGIFLGYIYEGMSDLTRSEHYYLDHLASNPTSKFAVTRLAALYERMGEPEKALPYLEKLYAYRPHDEELALTYLNLLENMHDEAALYKGQLLVAHNLETLPRPPVQRISELLNDAYDYAEWHDLTDDQYAILADLVKVARNKNEYAWITRHLDMNLKKTDQVIVALQKKVSENPNDIDAVDELAGIYIMIGRWQDAAAMIAPYLEKSPNNPALLQTRMAIDDKSKNMPQLIRDAQQLLELHVLSDEEEWDTKSTLAYAYQANHQYAEALTAYEEILNHDRSDPDNWLSVAFVLESMDRLPALVDFLKDYLVKFPADAVREKMLVDIYLYRLKDLSQLPLYRQYVQKTHQAGFALDVGNALIVGHQPAAAIEWLTEMHAIFPQNTEIVDQLAQINVATKKYAAAKSWYKMLAALKPNDMATQLTVGREIYFMDDPAAAEPYLKTVVANDVTNVDAWFWLSEIHSQFSETAAMKDDAQHVVALLTDHPPHTDTYTWMLLRSRGRVEKKPVVLLPEYQVAVAQYPQNPDLLADEIDIQLGAKREKAARQNIAVFRERFPAENERARMLDVRLAFGEKRWKDAIALLEPLVAENPHNWGLHRDLGEAYSHDNQWWKAIPELEQVQEATGERFKVADLLRDLHHEYDTRVTPMFNYTRYGSEYFSIWGVKFKDYVTHNWELNSDVRLGRFVSPSAGYTGYTESGKVMMMSHHFEPWSFAFGVEGAGSSQRTTAAPLVEMDYKPSSQTSFKLMAGYRQLRQDFPQAVAFGTLMDTASIEGQTVLLDRLVLSAKYSAERDYLPTGATAYGNTVEPAVNVIILRHPYVTLGWQMDYQRINSNGGFLTAVPLIPYMNAQYATGLISGRPIPKLLLEGGFYDGHDFDRGLSILNGDLWGVRGMFEWAANTWLDVYGSYEFGRQRLLDIPGYSNVVNFGLSGHW